MVVYNKYTKCRPSHKNKQHFHRLSNVMILVMCNVDEIASVERASEGMTGFVIIR